MERDPVVKDAHVTEAMISTHALTWSATIVDIAFFAELTNFNSRAHVERDARSADALSHQRHFNSRAHVERDILMYKCFCVK